jgi:four helix bundle protein
MSSDFKKLDVFHLADALVLDVYKQTRGFPANETYGLQAQLRRASVSVPCNIVEGSVRESGNDYAHFLRIACGSASEARYLVTICARLGYFAPAIAADIEGRFGRVVRALEVLARRVKTSHSRE